MHAKIFPHFVLISTINLTVLQKQTWSSASLYFVLFSWNEKCLKYLQKQRSCQKSERGRHRRCESHVGARTRHCSHGQVCWGAAESSARPNSLQDALTHVPGTYQSLVWWGSLSGCSGRPRPRRALQSQPSLPRRGWLLPGTSQCSSCTWFSYFQTSWTPTVGRGGAEWRTQSIWPDKARSLQSVVFGTAHTRTPAPCQ